MHFREIKQPEILIYPQWRTLDFKRGQRKNALASKGKLCRPETMTAGNQYARHDLSVWNKQQKSHLVSQNVFLQNITTRQRKRKNYWNKQHFGMRWKLCVAYRPPFLHYELDCREARVSKVAFTHMCQPSLCKTEKGWGGMETWSTRRITAEKDK